MVLLGRTPKEKKTMATYKINKRRWNTETQKSEPVTSKTVTKDEFVNYCLVRSMSSPVLVTYDWENDTHNIEE